LSEKGLAIYRTWHYSSRAGSQNAGDVMLRTLCIALACLLVGGCATTTVGTLHYPATDYRSKIILVALDGTGNTAVSRTNAARLYEAFEAKALAGDRPVATYYSEGVGSRGDLPGLAAGNGISADVRQAYDFLSRTYRPGDDLIFTGFSRGAYAARILGGMLAIGGLADTRSLPKSRRARFIAHLYSVYKNSQGLRTYDEHMRERREAMDRVYRLYGIPVHNQHVGVRIKVMALWDTVEALGFPDGSENPTENLTRYYINRCNVDHAFHALSLNDNRAYSFTPIFIDGPRMIESCADNQTNVREVWFSGAHADVGGSYDWDRVLDGRLPGVSYNWMIDRLKKVLTNQPAVLPPAPVAFAPVAALDPVLEDVDGPIHDARRSVFAYRVLWRNYREPLAYHKVAKIPGVPRVHISALERLLIAKALDQIEERCRAGGKISGAPPLVCSGTIGAYGLVKEMVDKKCMEDSPHGWRLIRGQGCIVVECRDGSSSGYYCGDEQTYQRCRYLGLPATTGRPTDAFNSPLPTADRRCPAEPLRAALARVPPDPRFSPNSQAFPNPLRR
jgi:uncharacterized protein (DUF2235 family)